MQTVNIKRTDLLDIIKKNRDEHRALFLKAQTGFRKLYIEKLDEMLKDAREGRKFDLFIGMAMPKDQTKDYDRIVRQLELSVDDVIELSQQEFAQYVMDDWQWKEAVTTANTYYASHS